MLKPLANFMIIEVIKKSKIELPDNAKSSPGDLFLVKDVGPGWRADNGLLVRCDVQKGDIVACVGKILRIPYNHKEVLIARADDCIAYERQEKLDIPDKV